MARQTHYLQLHAGETAAQIVERLAALPRGARALFILPSDALPFQRRLDLTLVLRAASRRAIRIALVSQHPQILHHAAALKVSAFATVGAAEGKRWKRGRARAFSGRDGREATDFEAPTRPVRAETTLPPTPIARVRGFLLRAMATILLFALPIVAAAYFLPSASITITPRLSVIERNILLRADPKIGAIDFEASAIPVTQFVVERELSARRASSGSTVQPQSLASGVVTFTNRTTREIVIPAGTALATADEPPHRFRTTAAARVPAGFGLTVDVTIEAQQSSAGKRGNLPAGAIEVVAAPFAESVRVVNVEATGGGRDASYPVVTAADWAALRSQLESEISAVAYAEMSARLEPGQTIILQSLVIPPARQQESWARYSAGVGEIVDEVTLTLNAEVVALAYRQSDVQQVALAQLSAARSRGQLFLPERTRVDCCAVAAANEDGSVTLMLQATAQYATELSVADYRAPLAGRRLVDAARWLADNALLDTDSPPEMELSPAWFGRLPFWAERIAITTALPEAP